MGSRGCPSGCDCKRHTNSGNREGRKCQVGCLCRRHDPEVRARVSTTLKERYPAKEMPSRMKAGSPELREVFRQRQLSKGDPWRYQGKLIRKDLPHRRVLFEKIGPGPHPCHWCGERVDWWTGLHVDHLNGDHLDNRPENIVPSCLLCNRIGARLGKRRRSLRPCERCGQQTINRKYCSRGCANVR